MTQFTNFHIKILNIFYDLMHQFEKQREEVQVVSNCW